MSNSIPRYVSDTHVVDMFADCERSDLQVHSPAKTPPQMAGSSVGLEASLHGSSAVGVSLVPRDPSSGPLSMRYHRPITGHARMYPSIDYTLWHRY